ncbi:MAG: hypothetical protein JO279_04065 [Verrucomicrobia bacterium]|nr:hypothetical protein [Verrucomicrobiota bacterium]
MFESPRWFAGITLLLWFVSPNVLKAQDEESNSSQLLFVPPPVEGVISLGVYNSKGKLIRVLKRVAGIETFKSTSDGLVIDWDRKDAEGKPVPSGKYFARGVLIGDVKVEGVAFHLNDWADSSTDPRIRKVLSAALLDRQRPAVLADASQPEVLVLENHGTQSHPIALEFNPLTVKGAGANLLLLDKALLILIDPASGTEISRQNFADLRDADTLGDRTVVLSGNQITYRSNGASQDLKLPAEHLFRCAVLTSSIVVASKEANVWKLDGQEFAPLDTGEKGELLDLSAGRSDTAWLLVRTSTATLLKQIDPSGKIVREFELPPDLQTVRQLGASRNEDTLLLISDDGNTQRVVGVRFQAASQGKSIWEKWFDRTLTTFKFFDLKEGQVVPTDAKTDSPPVFVKPANNPMENTRQALFQLSITTDETGAWVVDSDGLPLLQVCETKNLQQTRCVSDGANGLRVYTSDGTVVEEYHVTSLENLFRFDAGAFD